MDALTEDGSQSQEESAGEETAAEEQEAEGETNEAAMVDERAQDIVDEERENRERRAQTQARYQDVERDW